MSDASGFIRHCVCIYTEPFDLRRREISGLIILSYTVAVSQNDDDVSKIIRKSYFLSHSFLKVWLQFIAMQYLNSYYIFSAVLFCEHKRINSMRRMYDNLNCFLAVYVCLFFLPFVLAQI